MNLLNTMTTMLAQKWEYLDYERQYSLLTGFFDPYLIQKFSLNARIPDPVNLSVKLFQDQVLEVGIPVHF